MSDGVIIEKSLFTGNVCLNNDADGNVTISQLTNVVKLTRRRAIELKECLSVVIDNSNVGIRE